MVKIENLPPEVLLIVFSHYVQSEGHEKFLRVIPLVCKTWNKLSSDGSLWSYVKPRNWKFLLFLSQRGLLYRTECLEIDFDESFIGMNLLPVLENIRDLKVLDLWNIDVSDDTITLLTEHCPHLERLRLAIARPSTTTLHEFDHFLTVCGPTLRQVDLDFNFLQEAGQEQLLLGIAAKCPELERLVFHLGDALIPIYELRSGCPKLREMEITCGHFMTPGINCSLGCGFKDLKKFKAIGINFSGLGLSLLKDSVDLEHLELFNNVNLVFDSILKIPSDKLRILDVTLDSPYKNLNALGGALFKWRHTLSVIDLSGWKCDVSCLLQCLVRENPNPQLESLFINGSNTDSYFLQKFIQKCKNLIYLNIDSKPYKGREKIKEALQSLRK